VAGGKEVYFVNRGGSKAGEKCSRQGTGLVRRKKCLKPEHSRKGEETKGDDRGQKVARGGNDHQKRGGQRAGGPMSGQGRWSSLKKEAFGMRAFGQPRKRSAKSGAVLRKTRRRE